MLQRVEDIPTEWVRNGLEVVRRKHKRKTGFDMLWTADEVLADLVSGKAALFVVGDIGFLILEVCGKPTKKYLNVWVSWFKPGKAKPLREALTADLDRIKTEMGCEWIQFTSPHLGWMAVQGDFVPYATIWRR